MVLHQVLVSASPRDAVTGSALRIRAILREFGQSEVFAFHIHPALLGDIRHVREFPVRGTSGMRDLTLVHVSMGDPEFVPFIESLGGRLIVSYHNLTPASQFEGWDAETVGLLRMGRAALPALCSRTVISLADSSFNASELKEVGFASVKVAGLVLAAEDMLNLTPAPWVLSAGPGPEGPTVLSVGQLYPHKRPDLVLAAFHLLVSRYRPDARLVLAGASRLPGYRRALERYTDQLALTSRVTLTGEISDGELVAWYRSADLLVTASEHEGFCVPLIEGMWFEVPTVARDNGAVRETLAGSGVLLPGDSGPSALAAAMAEVLNAPAAAEGLRTRQRERRTYFTLEATRARFLDAVGSLLPL